MKLLVKRVVYWQGMSSYYVQDQAGRWWHGAREDDGYIFRCYVGVARSAVAKILPPGEADDVTDGAVYEEIQKNAWRFVNPLERTTDIDKQIKHVEVFLQCH